MSEQIEDGGPAFPKTITAGDKSISEGGLTIRDYFAGQALAGLLVNYDTHSLKVADCVGISYDVADIMLKARAAK